MNPFQRLWRQISRPSLGLTIAAPLFAIAFGLSFSLYVFNRPTGVRSKMIRIETGASVAAIAARLERERLIKSPRLLRALAILTGASKNLTAGDHPFSGRMTTWDVLRELQVPRDVTRRVTVPEGLRKERVVEILARDLELDPTLLASLIVDPAFCSKLGVEANDLEGYLFPETYQVSVSTTEAQVLAVLVNQFHKIFGEKLKKDARRIGMTVHQIVTMASIIEGEAQLNDERATISAVYHNRIKKRMRLQADPTVQFALPDGPRRLFYKDYAFDSPYNTYRHSGLPPGPIMSPGAASLEAAANPADVDYLFFVARGDGAHVFTKTAAGHEAAKRQTRASRREGWKPSKRR